MGTTRVHHKDRVVILCRHSLRWFLEFEAIADDEVEPLRGVAPERFLLRGRSCGLDVADLGAERVLDPQ